MRAFHSPGRPAAHSLWTYFRLHEHDQARFGAQCRGAMQIKRDILLICAITLMAALSIAALAMYLRKPDRHHTTANPSAEWFVSDSAYFAQSVKERGIRVRPVIGAPEPLSSKLKQDLTNALQHGGVKILSSNAGWKTNALTLYITADQDGARIKLSYLLDWKDPKGEAVARVASQMLVDPTRSLIARDAWKDVSPDMKETFVRVLGDRIDPSKPAYFTDVWGPIPTGTARNIADDIARKFTRLLEQY